MRQHRRNPNPWRYADVSDFQPSPNMHAYRSAGHVVIMRKATQGVAGTQDRYTADVLAAHDAGLRVLHYHYADLDSLASSTREAAHFWHTVRPYFKAGDRLVLDVEQPGAIGWGMVPDWTLGFSRALLSHSGQRCIGYTYLSVFQFSAPSINVLGGEWVTAAWGGEVPRLGLGRTRWAHQYTNGQLGPEPHEFAGVGVADGNLLSRRAFRKLTRAA